MSAADIRFARLPAAHGLLWLKRSFAMFRKYPMAWLLLAVAYLMLVLIIGAVPLLGGIVATILKPVFNVGFLAAAWSQERGNAPKLTQLLAGFRANLYALVPLGIVYWVGMMLALAGSALGDQGTFARAFFWNEVPPDAYWAGFDAQRAMIAALVCALPVLCATWFAPALVVFNDAGPLTALWTSLRAALTNWRALLTLGVTLLLLTGVLPALLASLLIGVADKTGAALWMVLMAPVWIAFFATLCINDYVSYREVFASEQGTGDEPA
jgi:hypothetical protein